MSRSVSIDAHIFCWLLFFFFIRVRVPLSAPYFVVFWRNPFFLINSIHVSNMSFLHFFMVSARALIREWFIYLNASYSPQYCQARVLKGFVEHLLCQRAMPIATEYRCFRPRALMQNGSTENEKSCMKPKEKCHKCISRCGTLTTSCRSWQRRKC